MMRTHHFAGMKTQITVRIGYEFRFLEAAGIVARIPKRTRMNWLPGLVSQSAILWDRVTLIMKRVAKGQTKLEYFPRIPIPPSPNFSRIL